MKNFSHPFLREASSYVPPALSEIQLVPELFRLLKLSIDRHQRNSQFILTDSTNILFLSELMDVLVAC